MESVAVCTLDVYTDFMAAVVFDVFDIYNDCTVV